jgi:PleD family two-component response regulator
MFSPDSAPIETTRHAMSSPAASTILISDDDAIMLILYQRIFERRGGFQHVLYAPTAEEAILICQTQPIALVISDIAKPNVNGLEMLRRLRADPVTRRIPFLFVTCHADSFSQQMAFELGADGFITKPFSWDILLDRVYSLLKRPDNSGHPEAGLPTSH